YHRGGPSAEGDREAAAMRGRAGDQDDEQEDDEDDPYGDDFDVDDEIIEDHEDDHGEEQIFAAEMNRGNADGSSTMDDLLSKFANDDGLYADLDREQEAHQRKNEADGDDAQDGRGETSTESVSPSRSVRFDPLLDNSRRSLFATPGRELGTKQRGANTGDMSLQLAKMLSTNEDFTAGDQHALALAQNAGAESMSPTGRTVGATGPGSSCRLSVREERKRRPAEPVDWCEQKATCGGQEAHRVAPVPNLLIPWQP
ncbi:unnamed protein product, partial [Amoebophrya sp. A25]